MTDPTRKCREPHSEQSFLVLLSSDSSTNKENKGGEFYSFFQSILHDCPRLQNFRKMKLSKVSCSSVFFPPADKQTNPCEGIPLASGVSNRLSIDSGAAPGSKATVEESPRGEKMQLKGAK